jgi:thioredoxin-related protein
MNSSLKLKAITLIGLIYIGISSFSTIPSGDVKDEKSKAELNWLSFEKAVELQQKNPKKVVLDVYTDWCGWCKKMDKNTYTDPEVIKILNEKYYFVKLNAEQKEDIVYKDKTFKFKQEYKAHELAVSLLNGKMSYPITVFLDENMSILTVVPGYLTPKDLNPILKYFGEDIYRTKNWEEYSNENK